jgi:hypothetical protein
LRKRGQKIDCGEKVNFCGENKIKYPVHNQSMQNQDQIQENQETIQMWQEDKKGANAIDS